MDKGILYVVGTPIGNLSDMTQRAVDTLDACDVIFSENPATTGRLLAKYGIKKTARWYREDNHDRIAPQIIEELLMGNSVALVSEAGTPVVSDPGAKLVREVHAQGIKIIPIPGVSAVTTAISVFPVASSKFLFWGFAPRKEGEFRRMILDQLHLWVKEKMALIIFESPFRVKKTLEYLAKIRKELGEQELELTVGLGKEMTKVFEAYRYDTPEGMLSSENKDFKLDKGEATLVIVIKKRHNDTNE